VFNGRGSGRSYGPIFGTGDIVGVVLNRVDRTISYTKNGYDLGVAFRDVSEEKLFPVAGFRTPDEEVVANFGDDTKGKPFKADVAWIEEDARQRLHARILATEIPMLPAQKVKDALLKKKKNLNCC
jgi:Ran-binding protein 9/10